VAIAMPDPDYNVLIERSAELYSLMPEKGYKGIKSAAMNCYSYCLLKTGRYDELETPVFKGLQYARECGEKEIEFYSALVVCIYYSIRGNHEKAFKIFGAMDAFIESYSYPVVGAAAVQYNEMKSVVMKSEGETDWQMWYEQGKKLRIEDALAYAADRN
jgi:hypothetical protein